jgi:hypothetical protein
MVIKIIINNSSQFHFYVESGIIKTWQFLLSYMDYSHQHFDPNRFLEYAKSKGFPLSSSDNRTELKEFSIVSR